MQLADKLYSQNVGAVQASISKFITGKDFVAVVAFQ